ncbi:Ankyrin-1 (ANK-1) (Ankyrin-R) (Erythrocyte ankyrin) [Durusdinium trenchii]|uniref:Ankyrin-1 (ANK-1) (Ankyrin-R) (Erythrocyte ankyrin) n=1 Tax=Durusdinium trenchii TaxID=1381693 RepID=A0ABP0RMH7_9DINO
MLCVFSAVSGEALASLDVEASEAEHQVRRLKARLAKQLGVSRFRQRWLGEDHSELPDDAMLDFSAQNVPVLNVQLVILEFVEAAEQSDQLVSACDKNCWEEVEALLCTPLSPTSFRDQLGRPALHAAARNGHWQCIRLLLEADAEKDEAILGLTALHLAAQRGHVGVVRLLLEAACDLHLVTLKQHETALHLAADHGHPEVVALLLEMKAEKDQARSRDGKTPLHLAAEKGHPEVLRLLLAAGAEKEKDLPQQAKAAEDSSEVKATCALRTWVSCIFILGVDSDTLHAAGSPGARLVRLEDCPVHRFRFERSEGSPGSAVLACALVDGRSLLVEMDGEASVTSATILGDAWNGAAPTGARWRNWPRGAQDLRLLPCRRVAMTLRRREMAGDTEAGDAVVVYGRSFESSNYRQLMLGRSMEADVPKSPDAAIKSLSSFLASRSFPDATAELERSLRRAAKPTAATLLLEPGSHAAAQLEGQLQAKSLGMSGPFQEA